MSDQIDPVRRIFRRPWLTTAGRGVLAVVVGVAIMFWPGTMISSVVELFSIFLLLDGVLNVAGAVGFGVDRRDVESDRRVQRILTIVLGVVELAAGIYGIARPEGAVTVMVTVIGAWAVVMGLWELVTALRARKYVRGVQPLVLAGGLFVVVGAFVIWRPWFSLEVVAWIIAVAAVLWGVMQIVVAFLIRRWVADVDDRLEVDREPPRMID